ncbi:uncharacterized protein [Rutidosis leptorrhynchoides]|uniref:uncharacterized protein n=1 Tax=Rutidosis leptorrhynchoides TaxID=125765 RepID=UPI003A991917
MLMMKEMKIASWNIRGMTYSDKQNEVKKFTKDEKLCFCAVLETHLKQKNIDGACSNVFDKWKWHSNIRYSANSCRIVVGWDENVVRVMVISTTRQSMLCLVEAVGMHTKIYCSVVYASNNIKERQKLWKELSVHKVIAKDCPWVIMGDFNVTRKIDEHSAGGSCLTDEMKEFVDCINEIEVDDIGSTGFNFTWTKSLRIQCVVF